MKLNKKQKKLVKNILIYTTLIVLALIALMPFYWSVLISFRPQDKIHELPVNWLPTSFTFNHYIEVFKNVDLGRYFFNTIFLTVVNIFTNLFLGAMAAYGFAKLKFKGSNSMFKVFMTSMMLPGIVTMVPTFLLLRSFPLFGGNDILGQGGKGLIGTYLGVLLPGTVGVYCIFFLRQFFLPISNEYAEAARIDGAGEFRIFRQIYLPMIIPALLTLGIFCFQGSWNSFMWPNLILQGNPDLSVLTMALRAYSIKTSYQLGPMMAISIIMSIPIIVTFCCAQKYFIGGVSVGGLKG